MSDDEPTLWVADYVEPGWPGYRITRVVDAPTAEAAAAASRAPDGCAVRIYGPLDQSTYAEFVVERSTIARAA